MQPQRCLAFSARSAAGRARHKDDHKEVDMTAPTASANALRDAKDRLRNSTLGHVIRGTTEPASDADRLEVLNPATAEVIAATPLGSESDVDRAAAAAREAFGGWRSTPPVERASILNSVADVVEAHAEELAALESLNVGKPLSLSREEMPLVADVFRFMGGAARALQAPATDEYVRGYISSVRREPVGVVGAITPWNYPLVTASFKMAAALAMGNTVVLKPSELTPLTTLRFMELVADILPAGVINIVLGTGSDVGAAISRHPGIDLMSLTGSVASGRRVMGDASRTLKPTHLELGGKAPVVVFDDANLDLVAEGVRAAGFVNSGQECGAATRIICDESTRNDLVERLTAEISTIKVGSPAEGEDIEMGPLVSQTHLQRVSSMVSRAQEEGATIVSGGASPHRDGYFFTPTVVTDVAGGNVIASEEVFGPVISVETFRDEDEAIRLSNDVPFGLAASVWTESVGLAMRVSSALDFGTVWVNCHLVMAAEMPWGGYGASGHGRELSTLGLEDFSRAKHVQIATGDA